MLRRNGAEPEAKLVERHAAEVEEAIDAWWEEPLTLRREVVLRGIPAKLHVKPLPDAALERLCNRENPLQVLASIIADGGPDAEVTRRAMGPVPAGLLAAASGEEVPR